MEFSSDYLLGVDLGVSTSSDYLGVDFKLIIEGRV